MTIIFFGNTKYSLIGARIISTTYPLSLIVTISDSPVARWAKSLNIPFLETKKFDQEIFQKIASVKADFFIVEDYGLILPKAILDLPKYAPLNIHHSLLPKYRGPSPAPAAILNGDKISGVTIIRITQQVDAGDILAQREYKLSDRETTDSLLTELNDLGGKLVIQVIIQFLAGDIHPAPQHQLEAAYTKKLIKQDGYFDINNPPPDQKLDRMIRAYYPWPTAWTVWPFGSAQDKKGKIVKFLPNQMLQMEGKKPIPFRDFLNGYPDFPLKKLNILTF